MLTPPGYDGFLRPKSERKTPQVRCLRTWMQNLKMMWNLMPEVIPRDGFPHLGAVYEFATQGSRFKHLGAPVLQEPIFSAIVQFESVLQQQRVCNLKFFD